MTNTETAMHVTERPAWAEETLIQDDLNSSIITHMWTARSSAEDDDGALLTVQLRRDGDLKVEGETVVYREGETNIFLAGCDTGFRSSIEGRRFAAAILEVCDRWDGAQEETSMNAAADEQDDEILIVDADWLRDGRESFYFDELRVLVVVPTLDEAGRRRALESVTR